MKSDKGANQIPSKSTEACLMKARHVEVVIPMQIRPKMMQISRFTRSEKTGSRGAKKLTEDTKPLHSRAPAASPQHVKHSVSDWQYIIQAYLLNVF